MNTATLCKNSLGHKKWQKAEFLAAWWRSIIRLIKLSPEKRYRVPRLETTEIAIISSGLPLTWDVSYIFANEKNQCNDPKGCM